MFIELIDWVSYHKWYYKLQSLRNWLDVRSDHRPLQDWRVRHLFTHRVLHWVHIRFKLSAVFIQSVSLNCISVKVLLWIVWSRHSLNIFGHKMALTTQYFKDLVTKETKRLNQLCEHWVDLMDNEANITEEGLSLLTIWQLTYNGSHDSSAFKWSNLLYFS